MATLVVLVQREEDARIYPRSVQTVVVRNDGPGEFQRHRISIIRFDGVEEANEFLLSVPPCPCLGVTAVEVRTPINSERAVVDIYRVEAVPGSSNVRIAGTFFGIAELGDHIRFHLGYCGFTGTAFHGRLGMLNALYGLGLSASENQFLENDETDLASETPPPGWCSLDDFLEDEGDEHWAPQEWEAKEPSYLELPEGFTFGVEVETINSTRVMPGMRESKWGRAYEASTPGAEYISPVLYADQGLREVESFLEKFGPRWRVDHRCGLHVHFAYKGWTPEQQQRVATRLRGMEDSFQTMFPERMTNRMCGRAAWTVTDAMFCEDWETFVQSTDKFHWLNLRPLLRQGTMEIRLHPGSVDAEQIVKWVKRIARLTYQAYSPSFDLAI